MCMITIRSIFTILTVLLTFEGYFVQQNCNSRTAELLTPSRQMFRFDYLTSRLNIHISGKITTFTVLKKFFFKWKNQHFLNLFTYLVECCRRTFDVKMITYVMTQIFFAHLFPIMIFSVL